MFYIFVVYTYGSDQFANLFINISWDINFWQLFCLSVLGFFLAFNYWNFVVERLIYKQHSVLDNYFNDGAKILKPTYSGLGLDAERMSGVVTFYYSMFYLFSLLQVIIMSSSMRFLRHRYSFLKKLMKEWEQ